MFHGPAGPSLVIDVLASPAARYLPIHHPPYLPQRSDLDLLLRSVYERAQECSRITERALYLGEVYFVNVNQTSVGREALVIDPGQWLTTTVLLIVALARAVHEEGSKPGLGARFGYPLHLPGTSIGSYRLLLGAHDRDTLCCLAEGRPLPSVPSRSIVETVDYFSAGLAELGIPLSTVRLDQLAVTEINILGRTPVHHLYTRLLGRQTGTVMDRVSDIVFLTVRPAQQEALYRELWLPLMASFDTCPAGFGRLMGEVLSRGGAECRDLVRAGRLCEALDLTAGEAAVEAWARSLALQV